MKDTHFPQKLPAAKRCRVATLCDAQEAAEEKRQRTAEGASTKPYVLSAYTHKVSAPGIMSSGGGILTYMDAGMMSTARDYSRFCQMLLDGGIGPGGRRILSEKTIRMLWQDSLAPYARGHKKRVLGWNNCGGRRGFKYWDYVSWSALGAHVTFNQRFRDVSRTTHTDATFAVPDVCKTTTYTCEFPN